MLTRDSTIYINRERGEERCNQLDEKSHSLNEGGKQAGRLQQKHASLRSNKRAGDKKQSRAEQNKAKQYGCAHVLVSCVTKAPKDLPTMTFQVPLHRTTATHVMSTQQSKNKKTTTGG